MQTEMGPWSLGLAQSCWQCPVIDPSENNIACSQAHLGPSCPLLPPYCFLSFYSVSPEALSCQIYLWHISDIWRLNSKVQELTLPLGTRGWNWYFHTIDNEASIQEQLPPIPTARWDHFLYCFITRSFHSALLNTTLPENTTLLPPFPLIIRLPKVEDP